MAKRAFIIGGSGQIGHATAAVLLTRGWEVTLASRGLRAHAAPPPAGATTIAFDRDAPDALAKCLAGGADAVIDTIAFDASHARRLLDMQEDIGALIAISSISVYCDKAGRSLDEARDTGSRPRLEAPATESHQTVPAGAATYSTRKVAMENELLEKARIAVTILRPGAIHGPYSPHPREWWFVKRLLDGRTVIPLKYQGGSLFSQSSTVNIARLSALALQQPRTRILNAVDARALTVEEIGREIVNVMQRDCRFALFDELADAEHIGATPWSTAFPFLASGQAAAELGFAALPYEATLRPYCDWMVSVAQAHDWREVFPVIAQYEKQAFDFAAEDKYLAQLAT